MLYTVLIRQDSNQGTTAINSFDADNAEHAGALALEQVAKDWQTTPDCLHVLGILKGDVEITYWEDFCEIGA